MNQELLTEFTLAISKMHTQGAMRTCASSQIFQNCYVMNGGSPILSAIGAMSSMGGIHFPLEACYQFLSIKDIDSHIQETYNHGCMIPGYGSSFVKGKPDSVFTDVRTVLSQRAPNKLAQIDELTKKVHEITGKNIYPNMALYTAMCGIILDINWKKLMLICIAVRMNIWAQMIEKID